MPPTQHYDDEGYDVMSACMVKVVFALEGEEVESSQYNEEIILQGPNKNHAITVQELF